MPTPTEQLLSRTLYDTDGATTIWDFSFASGYLDPSHVKAFTTDANGARTDIVVTLGMLVSQFQLQITPALANGLVLTIYRDTPKNAPLVDFIDESNFSEFALDTNAKQAIMVAAEAIDTINTSDLGAAITAADQATLAAVAAQASAASASAAVSSIGTAVTDAQAAAAAAAASAALINPADFATAAQGAKADTAVQPAGFTIAAINGATALGRNLMAVVDAAAARVLLGLSTFGSSLVQAADAAVARVLLGAAASGANSDITSLTGLTSGIVGTSGNQTIGGVKTFSSMPVMPVQSMVRLTGSNGYGSTNTAIWRLTTLVVNQGSDIAYADSATLGASFTINTSGVYSATFRMVPSGINGGLGISLNSSQLSTNILSIASADSVSGMQINNANTMATCSWTGYLAAGSVIRPHGDGGAAGNTTAPAFTITRVA